MPHNERSQLVKASPACMSRFGFTRLGSSFSHGNLVRAVRFSLGRVQLKPGLAGSRPILKARAFGTGLSPRVPSDFPANNRLQIGPNFSGHYPRLPLSGNLEIIPWVSRVIQLFPGSPHSLCSDSATNCTGIRRDINQRL